MNRYSLSQLSNAALDTAFESSVATERMSTADLLRLMGESDARKRYRPAGYPSMRAYCIGKLNLSEPAAGKRIYVARAARRFPVLLEALASGQVHLSGLVLLVRHLTPDTVGELLAAARRKTRDEIELMLAQRCPKPDVPTQIRPVSPSASPASEHSPGNAGESLPLAAPEVTPSAPATPDPAQHSPGNAAVEQAGPPARVTPLAPQRFGLQTTIDQETRDLLERAQNLLGHRVSGGNIAEVLKLALATLVEKLEKSKFGATSKPQPARATSENSRRIPAHVQRAVWKRDGGQCTFKSADGHRCEARSDLEFDHVIPVARGGKSEVGNVRLLCRAHNQLEAEHTYGAQFMEGKRRAS